jgi:TatD DNase family protein
MAILIDTHAHLQLKDYDGEREQIIKECRINNLHIINVGTNFDDSRSGLVLANQNDNCWASIGVHPTEVLASDFLSTEFDKLVSTKTIAVGETGLDFWHLDELQKKYILSEAEIINRQLNSFNQQLRFAKKHDLPVIIHGRNGADHKNVYKIILSMLADNKITKAVFHCFGGNSDDAEKIINQGYYLGFDGPITYKKNEELRKIITMLPSEYILAETDCPFLAPEPYRGQRNQPLYVKEVVSMLAEIKKIGVQEMEDILWLNAQKLFGFKINVEKYF